MRDRGRRERERRPGRSRQEPLAVPLVTNTSRELRRVARTIPAPNLVQNQHSTSPVLASPPFLSASEPLDRGGHVQNFDQEQ